jgi:hypothetical protein
MYRKTTILAALIALAAAAPALSAQAIPPTTPDTVAAPTLFTRHKLAGPRFGFTSFTGSVAKMRQKAGLEPMVTQFGWQWETQIVAQRSGSQVVMELVALAGGVEQSELTTSLGWLTGYRLLNGLELGCGPNISWNKDSEKFTTSMVVAGGSTLPFGDIRVPLNLAVGLSKGGPAITVLAGWIIG